jgi:hypothetical protein
MWELRLENLEVEFTETHKQLQERVQELRKVYQMKLKLEEEKKDLTKDVLQRGVESCITHAIMMLKTKVFMRKEFQRMLCKEENY